MGEGARRNLKRLTAGGAARRYYQVIVAEQAAYDVSRDISLQPKTEDDEDHLGGNEKWEIAGRGPGLDSRKEADQELPAQPGDKEADKTAISMPMVPTPSDQLLDVPREEGKSEDDNPPGATLLYSSLGVDAEMTEQTMSKEIHILGVGAIGKFIAHGLSSLTNPPPITLLMHRPLLMQQWHDEGCAIHLLREGQIHTQSGFNIESAANFRREKPNQRFAGFGPNLEHSAEPPETNIDTLIVTTAPKATIPALMTVRRRIRPSSTICIIGDGMGIVEDINTLVFPDPQRRPTYILGNVARSPYIRPSDRTFSIVQTGQVSIGCSKLPRKLVSPATDSQPSISRVDFSWSLPASYLVGLLARVPEFYTRTIGHKSFYKDQLLRLAVASVIGPVSVLHDCSNSELLMSHNAKVAMKSVVDEISLVIRSLPELQSLANIETDFGAIKLQTRVKSTLIKTAQNHSKMLEDVNAGRRTDIDYLNGYLLTRAAELGIRCPINEMLVNVVKGKQMIKSRILDGHVPFMNGGRAS